MKNEAEIIWWKTVKQDVETTPLGFTEAAARVWKGGGGVVDRGSSRRDGRRWRAFLRDCGCSLSAIIIYAICLIKRQIFKKFPFISIFQNVLIKFSYKFK